MTVAVRLRAKVASSRAGRRGCAMRRSGGVARPRRRGLLGISPAVTLLLAATSGALAADYAGNEVCLSCHADQAEAMKTTAMGMILLEAPRNSLEKRGCESCHGPGSIHVDDGGQTLGGMLSFRAAANEPVARKNRACVQCHERGAQVYWDGSPHESRGIACVDCHEVMRRSTDRYQLKAREKRTPLRFSRAETEICLPCHMEQRAQLFRSSHMPLREGKLTCSTCHNPHGSAGPQLLRENSVNENCYRCHAERRGPFLWEHPPVRENCLNCHEAHGSINTALLKVKMPRLCQRCHIETGHPTRPFAQTSRFVFARSCANCHPQIHGSNHPSGVRFQR